MSGPLLQVRDLRIEFATRTGPVAVVEDAAFDIDAGETVSLVGESGCGKTLTALSILGLLPVGARVAAGSIRFEGRDLLGLPPAEMRRIRGNRIAMIFQEPMTSLNPVFTIGTQIIETIRLHQRIPVAAARRLAAELLDRVGMPDPVRRLGEYPHQLSGGMRQRAMIAMAIACRPRLLLADEPTTALDVTVQAQVFELLRSLAAESGMSILLITHDLAVVGENARRVAVMYAGQIVEVGERADLFRAPVHPYTRLLFRAIPARGEPGGRLATIEGQVPPPTAYARGCRFVNRCPVAREECADQPPPVRSRPHGRRFRCWHPDGGQLRVHASAGQPPQPARAGPVLEVTGLQVYFPVRRAGWGRSAGVVRAVDGVDLVIAGGETLALVGESGCGKTTVGHAIVGLAPVRAGSIRLKGTDLVGMSRRRLRPFRRRIQMIFQDPQSSLDPRMTIGDAILEGMETHGIGANRSQRLERVGRLLERVGLRREMAGRYPHEFSGGQRQRVCLARALAVEPEVLICDEATSSLDVSVQAQVLNLLTDLQAEFGLAYLFITHDLAVVRHLARRVAVMYLGRIVEQGPAGAVLAAPRHPYTEALLSAVPSVDGDGRRRIVLSGDVPSPVNPPPGCPFHPRCPRAMAICRSVAPPRADFGGGHTAACWLHGPDSTPNAPG